MAGLSLMLHMAVQVSLLQRLALEGASRNYQGAAPEAARPRRRREQEAGGRAQSVRGRGLGGLNSSGSSLQAPTDGFTEESGLCRNKDEDGDWNSRTHGGLCMRPATTKEDCRSFCAGYAACRAAGVYGGCDLFTGVLAAPDDCPAGFNTYSGLNDGNTPDMGAYFGQNHSGYEAPAAVCLIKTTGTDDQSSIVGDPHVRNVANVGFDIRAEGEHKLVQIPKHIHSSNTPDLRLDAMIQHLEGSDCAKSFMTSLAVFGRWTEESFGLMRITQGSDMPNSTLLINTQDPVTFFSTQRPFPGVHAEGSSFVFTLRDVRFHVGKHFEGRYGRQRAYLNLRVTGLKKYEDVGGLLGYDDHTAAEKPTANCTVAQVAEYNSQGSFIGTARSAQGTDGGSRIVAE